TASELPCAGPASDSCASATCARAPSPSALYRRYSPSIDLIRMFMSSSRAEPPQQHGHAAAGWYSSSIGTGGAGGGERHLQPLQQSATGWSRRTPDAVGAEVRLAADRDRDVLSRRRERIF